ncbi:DUF4350 domain-containing protein [Euzebya pacifica]|uniref:DUF4350 domain-containing protein n=1 Tax=Euzebya pacifica TaxID=1608957 RepID=UPI0030F5DFBF
MTRRRWRILGAVVLVVLTVVAIGPRRGDGPPLDPDSTGPAGVRGILDVLEEVGADVEVTDGVPTAAHETALVILDQMTDMQRDGVRGWVDDGGTLVVADPLSALAPGLGGVTSIAFTEPTIEPACDDPAVADVDRVSVADGIVFTLPAGASGCFPRNDGHWMVTEQVGRGHIVSLGGPFTLTNDLLDAADNAVLLVNLLQPVDGGAVRVIRGDDPAARGEDGLLDVLPEQVQVALLQIPLLWLAVLWWRAPRHGRPVWEDPPIRVDASETTVSTGHLLQRAGRAGDAGAVLRQQALVELHSRLGIPEDVHGEELIVLVADRTRLPADDLRRALGGPLPRTDDELVDLARRTAALRRALHRVDANRPPTDDLVPNRSPDRE